MSPTPQAAWPVAVVAASALVVPAWIAGLAMIAVVALIAADAASSRRAPSIERRFPSILPRATPSRFTVEVQEDVSGRVRMRQPLPSDVDLTPSESDDRLDGALTARRRGRHVLAPVALRRDGPLGLGCWYHRVGEDAEVLVYPDVPAARRLALEVRRGRFREAGRRSGGPLGLGTEFESIRDYLPDDDIRQVNWRATARLGRPMSNQYRIEHDRDVMCVVDSGRLMEAPLDDRTRLDAAVDAVTAVALTCDEVGDRCGVLTFDEEVRRHVAARRKGGEAVVRAIFDVEPTPVESDYELAFRTVGHGKRALVLVLTDLLEESAARPLVEAVPVLARHHAVVVATATDPDLDRVIKTPPHEATGAYAMVVALEVLRARARAAAELRHAGAEVVEAPPDRLGAACVGAYLRAKARARL